MSRCTSPAPMEAAVGLLVSESAYYAGRPMRTNADLRRPLETSMTPWEPPDECQPGTGERQTLFVRLLELGGWTALVPFNEPDFSRILMRGQLWYGTDVRRVRGRPHGCHENSALLWRKRRRELRLVTGYALSDDGMWRQHSWCIRPMPSGSWRVVETTTSRVGYYGFVLIDTEADEFYARNV